MPKFSPKESREIQKILIDEGIRRFTEKGLRKTTVEELCRHAAIAKGSFYHFFENKEVLFFRCMEAQESLIEEKELQPLMNNFSDPEGMIRDLLQFSLELPEVYPFLNRAMEPETLMQLNKKLPENLWNSHYKKDLDDTEKMFSFWQSQGLFCSLDGATFNGVFRAFIMLSYHRKEIGEIVFPPVMDLMVRALAKELASYMTIKKNLNNKNTKGRP